MSPTPPTQIEGPGTDARTEADMAGRAGGVVGPVERPTTAGAPVSTYADFLARKTATQPSVGIELDHVHPSLFPHQAEAVRWAAARGRAATFLDTGLGKTRIQLAWADAMRHGRRFIGCELKPSYWQTATSNLRTAENDARVPSLFDLKGAL